MKRYTIERNDYCLCGSGLKYKKCCLEYMSYPIDYKLISAEINNGNFELALKY